MNKKIGNAICIKKYLILIMPILVLLFFIAIYLVKFHNGLSSDSEDWGDFGSYIGGISSLIFSGAAIYASYKVSIYNYNISMVDKYMYLIFQEMNEVEQLLTELKLLRLKNPNEFLNLANGSANPEHMQQIENMKNMYLKNCDTHIQKVKLKIKLCFSRYGLQYSNKNHLLNSLNERFDTVEKVESACKEIKSFLFYYTEGNLKENNQHNV